MTLTLSQAASQLGKTQRQIRYLIQEGRLKARKDGGRWVVDSADLPLAGPRQEAQARRQDRLRDAADEALGPRPAKRWGLKDLKAITIGVPLYQRARDCFGDDALPTRELRAGLDLLAVGAHRFGATDKRDAYRGARDAAARAAMALLLAPGPEAETLFAEIERELMPAIVGALRRTERRDRYSEAPT